MKARRIKSLARGLLDGSPAGRSNTRPLGGQVAQLVEQRTENPRVGGSIPPLATMKLLNFLELFIGPFWWFWCISSSAVIFTAFAWSRAVTQPIERDAIYR